MKKFFLSISDGIFLKRFPDFIFYVRATFQALSCHFRTYVPYISNHISIHKQHLMHHSRAISGTTDVFENSVNGRNEKIPI